MQATPLQQAHQKLNAAFSEVAGWAIPEHFGNVAAEYDAARTGAAIADASHRGRIVARGKDTLDLLNRLSTNLVDPLPPDAGQSTVVTTGKGRVVDWITVLPWGPTTCSCSPLRSVGPKWPSGSTCSPSMKTPPLKT